MQQEQNVFVTEKKECFCDKKRASFFLAKTEFIVAFLSYENKNLWFDQDNSRVSKRIWEVPVS